MAAASLNDILDAIRNVSSSERNKGTRFEILFKRFLESEPIYKDRFSKVWLWQDWSGRTAKGDRGIDLVAQERVSGEYCAIQCKCFAPDYTLKAEDLGTFFMCLTMSWDTPEGRQPFTSGMIAATTDRWSDIIFSSLNACRHIPVTRVGLSEMANSAVDWEAVAKGYSSDPEAPLLLRRKHSLKKHQKVAIEDVISGFRVHDRGKLIMACGTGKTFTSLRLAEQYTQSKGTVLFLVPSIALLSQALCAWYEQAAEPLHAIAVCSDAQASQKRKGDEADRADLTSSDLPWPACTSPASLGKQFLHWKGKQEMDGGMIVVFSTYQSIEAVANAQSAGVLPVFDLIICDEAHRTTGVSLKNEKGELDESAFVRVHNDDFIRGRKRLYMTATPRIYKEDTRKKAEDSGAVVASMDDEVCYGPELHRLPFSKAVGEGLLADYKVLVLCVDEGFVEQSIRLPLISQGHEMELDDAVKLLGCYNGLRKKLARIAVAEAQSPEADILKTDPAPMQRAVAFAGRIRDSKLICEQMRLIVDGVKELEDGEVDAFLPCSIEHVDGTMNTQKRNALLSWLEDGGAADDVAGCRILSNARCLSEGVDVPALDAVMFLSPRKSQVDIVQSVGRVMRTAPGKKYGYIILPVGVPAGVSPEEVLDKDAKYQVVWDVLQALRAHDDRFNAEINKIDLNKKKGARINIVDGTGRIGKEYGEDEEGDLTVSSGEAVSEYLPGWSLTIGEWREAILARVVKKCGDRRYWEEWAGDIAAIAEKQTSQIQDLLESGHGQAEFQRFLNGLRDNIHPNITEQEAVEMLAQQTITRPVFDALFDHYAFAEKNPVSKTMNGMLELIAEKTSDEDRKKLQSFYESVRQRAAGIDNSAGRQKVVVELYDKFFKKAFPKMMEKLGIVYTPIELVDFIIHSVHDVLKESFGLERGLAEDGVKIMDPFIGTGTFVVRLIQSGLIPAEKLLQKYSDEIFASEIVLLAYYIACVNIEGAFHEAMERGGEGNGDYKAFPGICLTDTFLMGERESFVSDLFGENWKRVRHVSKQDIRVIVGNPPYSVGQKSANDNNQNQSYPELDGKIANTYAAESEAVNQRNLYDSYIRAFRWASDRITEDGIVAYVTNGSFIDNGAMDGFRKSLMKEFSDIYCFNLRGNQRTSGELSRKEGGKVFGSGSRTPVAITILVKKKGHQGEAKLHYHDIGDYLTREQKLSIVKEHGSIRNMEWQELIPDKHGDWLNHRDDSYQNYLPLGDKETKGKENCKAIFGTFCLGTTTARDSWCYNFSQDALIRNMQKTMAFFNENLGKERKYSPTHINWTRATRNNHEKGKQMLYEPSHLRLGLYRPFCKSNLYFDRDWNEVLYQLPQFFPTPQHENLVIQLTGNGSTKPFSCLITDITPDLENISKGQCFPLYVYEKSNPEENLLGLGLEDRRGDYRRKSAITGHALRLFRKAYGDVTITEEDVFYYIYAMLHSPQYREKYGNNLKKELPRIPFLKEFRRWSAAGRELAKWHLNYETVEPWPVEEVGTPGRMGYRVEKLSFPKEGQRDSIIYNGDITLTGIPEEAYDYVVNGKSAIEWIMDRYQVKRDKESGILNDPNAWCVEHDDPRYIIDLLKKVIRVSMESVRIVNSLPVPEEL